MSTSSTTSNIPSTATLGSIVRGASVTLLVLITGGVLLFFTQVLLANWLTIDDYGAYNFTLSLVEIFLLISCLGFPIGVVKLLSQYRATNQLGLFKGLLIRSRQLVLGSSTVLAVSAAVGYLMLIHAGLLTPSPGLPLGFILLPMWSMVLLYQGIARAEQTMLLAYGPQLVLRFALTMLIAFVIVSAAGQLTINTALIATAAALFLTVSITMFSYHWPRRTIQQSVIATFQTQAWLIFALPFFIKAGMSVIHKNIDIIILGTTLTKADVGIYTAAVSAVAFMEFVLLSVNSIFAPKISEFHAQGRLSELQQTLRQISHLLFWPNLILVGIVIAFGPFILSIYGAEFISAYTVLIVLALAQLANASAGSVGYILAMTGYARTNAIVFGAASVLNVILNLLLIPYLGINGAALATLITTAAWNATLHTLVVREHGLYPSFLATVVHEVKTALK